MAGGDPMLDVIALDHLYLTVSDLPRSERFWDPVMQRLGFFKGDKPIGGEPHVHYFNRVLQITLRPARSDGPHDPYAPGLHHVCLQLADAARVDAAITALHEIGVDASEAKLYPKYGADYYATFFEDPDGIRFELVARREYRERIVRDWAELRVFANPLAELDARRARDPA